MNLIYKPMEFISQQWYGTTIENCGCLIEIKYQTEYPVFVNDHEIPCCIEELVETIRIEKD